MLRVPEVTVNDWIETDIDGGVAEQETRTIWNGKLVGTEDVPATMSVFVTGGSKDKYNATNAKWTHEGYGWTGASTILYEGVASLQQIYACSPYTEDGASGSIAVTATDQIDWLLALPTPLTSNSVELTMTHALAKLVLVGRCR